MTASEENPKSKSLFSLQDSIFGKSESPKENSSDDSSENQIVRTPTKRTIIEPAVLLIYIAISITSAVLQNQLLFQTCVSVYGYDQDVCEPMLGVTAKGDEAAAIETEIQPYVANIIMVNSLVSSVLPAFLSLLIGPWSDKFGRRPVLIATFSGALIGHVITTILSGISMATTVNPWVYVISYIPLALTGGTCSLITMVFCLVSDVSDVGGKAKRMFFVDGALGLGTVIGNQLASVVVSATGTIGVFGIAALLDFLALMYLCVFVGESLPVKHERQDSKIREFFKFDLIKDLVKSCIRRRPQYTRAIVWCIMFTLVATSFVTQGETNLLYLFLRNKFNVSLQQYSTYNSSSIGLKTVGCGLLLIITRVIFKVPLTVVAIFGLVSCFLDTATRAFAEQFWQMYAAAAMGFMSGINSPIFQAVLGGLIDPNEIGKIYAVISSLQTISPLISAPVYTAIYNATLETRPGDFFFLSSGIYLLSLVLITIMFIVHQRGAKRNPGQGPSALDV